MPFFWSTAESLLRQRQRERLKWWRRDDVSKGKELRRRQGREELSINSERLMLMVVEEDWRKMGGRLTSEWIAHACVGFIQAKDWMTVEIGET